MTKRTTSLSVMFNMERSDLKDFQDLATLDRTSVGHQLRRAIQDYLSLRSKDLKSKPGVKERQERKKAILRLLSKKEHQEQ